MTRDELVEVGAQALSEAWKAGVLLSQNEPGGVWFKDYGKFAATVLDAVEPLIRADKRDRQFVERIEDRSDYGKALIREVLTDLRAKVKAERDTDQRYLNRDSEAAARIVAYNWVLSLIDGAGS